MSAKPRFKWNETARTIDSWGYSYNAEDIRISSFKDDKILFTGSIQEMSTCCAIKELTGCQITTDQKTLNALVKSRRFRACIKAHDSNAYAGCRLCITTIVDNDRKQRMLIRALEAAGWKKFAKTKSNHGNYYVHMLGTKL